MASSTAAGKMSCLPAMRRQNLLAELCVLPASSLLSLSVVSSLLSPWSPGPRVHLRFF